MPHSEKYKLKTARTLLSPFGKEDLALFHDLNTDPFIRRYLWDDEVIPLELANELLEKNEAHFAEDQFGLWKIQLKSTGELVGYTGLWYFFAEPQPQLLYALLEMHCGKGLATECAQRIIDYAFNQLQFPHLVAAMDQPHEASRKVAERLQMQWTATREERGKPTLFYRIDHRKDHSSNG